VSVATPDAQLQTIRTLFDAFANLDRDAFADRLTEDVVFRPSAFVTGKAEFHGREEVRQNLAELKQQLADTGEQVLLNPVSVYVDEDDENTILALAVLTIVRPNGESYDTEMAYLHTMEGDKVAELRTWPDHAEGLKQLTSPQEAILPS
jgi:ketosteroid isomerase-like protein